MTRTRKKGENAFDDTDKKIGATKEEPRLENDEKNQQTPPKL